LGDHRALLQRRVLDKRIVEGHGDLRPEHICLTDPIVIFDSLEFSRDLRLCDPFDELAFLSLECAFLRAPWVGRVVVRRVGDGLGDHPPEILVRLYMASRGVLRARLSVAHLIDPEPREPEKWVPQAARYLQLTERALVDL
jgi:aminoglycoside phosphotransferase family enzyme